MLEANYWELGGVWLWIALSIVQVVVAAIVGLLVGRSLAGRQTPSESTDASTVRRLLAQVGAVTESLSADVSQYQRDVSRHATSLETLPSEAGGEGSGSVVLEIVREIIRSNQQLQKQLAAAELELDRQKELIAQHLETAKTDEMTGLPNRRAFNEHLQRLLAQFQRSESPLSLVLLDLDHFKALNDRYGHLAGDAVLREVGRIIQQALREMDIACRIGGEEFAILLPDTDLDEALVVAERARQAIAAAKIEFEGQRLRVTSSQGIAEAVRGDTSDSLIKRADDALYEAKRAGRNQSQVARARSTSTTKKAAPAAIRPTPLTEASPQAATSSATSDTASGELDPAIESLADELRAAIKSLPGRNDGPADRVEPVRSDR